MGSLDRLDTWRGQCVPGAPSLSLFMTGFSVPTMCLTLGRVCHGRGPYLVLGIMFWLGQGISQQTGSIAWSKGSECPRDPGQGCLTWNVMCA